MQKRRTMSSRPHLPPLPLDPIIDTSSVLQLSTLAFGGLMRVLCHFWQSGCADISREDLRFLARVSAWQREGEAIIRAFEEMRPLLLHKWQVRESNVLTLARLRRGYRQPWRSNNAPGQVYTPAATSKRAAVVAAAKVESRSQEANRFSD